MSALPFRLLPCGDRAVLVEFADPGTRRAAAERLRPLATHAEVSDLVLADRTILVRVHRTEQVADLVRAVHNNLTLDHPARDPSLADPAVTDTLTVPTRYDGPDLQAAAEAAQCSVPELIRWHCDQPWTVDFAGFAPGFGYLVRAQDTQPPHFPRLPAPRTRIPAGSVGLAGGYSGIYPGASSGGWLLIGITELRLWDSTADPPALLRPGVRVQFAEVDP
ncbi:5-oxoprolinase subunit B family protein [Dermacoccaceae bacterium W4C1]